jgi:hypothetical protein
MRKQIWFARWLACVYLSCMLPAPAATPAGDWRTKAEATGYQQTDRYPETMDYCRRLAAASEFVHLETIGRSPEGRDVAALVVSLDKAFTPEAARATGKEILLANACIHAGECEGKDAGLALIRDLVINGQYKTNGLLDHAILLFVPIHNVDGHERFGPYNRPNQNGPAEMGWRTTAQNYNLNRDWLKADAPEMRAELDLFHRWRPDLFMDIHTTDGADYQYDLTYTLENFGNEDPAVVAWQKKAFDGEIFPALEKMGHKLAPYIVLRTPDDPQSGFGVEATLPRFSTGYVALWNRPALLLETHMLKDYRTRVTGTYDLLVQILSYFKNHPGQLRHITEHADLETIAAGRTYDPARRIPVAFKPGPGHVPFEFLGVASHHQISPISGALWVQYDPAKPETFTVPFYNQMEVDRAICPPLGYVVPVAWTVVIDRLRDHGIAFDTLTKPLTQEVETYRIDHVEWEPQPFENHRLVKNWKVEPVRRTMTFPAGSALVYLDQPAARVALNLLEPDAPDSLARWGYLDAIFEQKEYADDRVMEVMAREMMAHDPKAKEEFEKKLAADPAFAASAKARLEFFYDRTPYHDDHLDIYPIGRIFERVAHP